MAQSAGSSITQRIALQGATEVLRQLKELGQAGEKAFKDIQAASSTANSRLGTIGSGISAVFGAFRQVAADLRPVRAAFSEVTRASGEFRNSVSDIANKVFPHFQETLTLGLAAGAAGFLEMTKSAAAAVRETENMAKTLGYTVDALEGLRLTAAKAGVETGSLDRALGIFARNVGKAREEHAKLTGDLGNGVAVLRGTAQAAGEAANSINVLRGGMHDAANAMANGVNVIRGGIQPLYDFSDGLKTLGLKIENYTDDARGNLKLLLDVSVALKQHENQTIGAQAAATLFGRAWREVMPALRDLDKGLRESLKTIEDFGIGIEDAEHRQARAFNASYTVMKVVLDRTREIIGNIFGQLLVPLFDAVTQAIARNLDSIKKWADEFVKSAMPVVEDFIRLLQGATEKDLKTDFVKGLVGAFQELRNVAQLTLDLIIGGFRALSIILSPVAALINAIFGTKFTGATLAATGAILYFTGIIGALGTALGVVVAAINVFAAAWGFLTGGNVIAAGLRVVIGLIPEIGSALAALVIPIAAVIGWPATLAIGIGVVIAAAITFMGKWGQVFDFLGRGFNGVIDWLTRVSNAIVDAIGKALRLIGLGGGGGGTGPEFSAPIPAAGMARGGRIAGPSGIDRVPIWATDGEFVIREPAVRMLGANFLAALNAFPQIFAGLRGGLGLALEGMAPPRPGVNFASGGLVTAGGSGGAPVHVHLGGQEFALHGDQAVVDSLVRASRSDQFRSTGRKPGWHAS